MVHRLHRDLAASELRSHPFEVGADALTCARHVVGGAGLEFSCGRALVPVAALLLRGKGARTEKAAQKAPAKGGQPQKGGPGGKGGKPAAQVKTLLPAAQKGEAKTQVEQLAAIANNRKVAIAREVGKLVAQRAKEKGVSKVVFDRGGYAYHGRVAAVAEGAREVGLDF